MRFNKRYTAPLLITLVLLGAHLSFGILESWRAVALAIGASILTELVLGRVFLGAWRNLASAYISGISVSILIRSLLLWPYALSSMLSIASKYVLRAKEQHLWNPSNFGICAMLFLAPSAVAPLSVQWGNNLWAMLIIWTIGLVTIWRLRRFHICATYIASFLLLALVRSWITGDPFLAEAAPITGPMYQLFVLFMITDPKTTVRSRRGEIAVAFAVALVELFLRLGESVYAPFYALFMVGPTALLIERWWNKHTTPTETPAAQPTA